LHLACPPCRERVNGHNQRAFAAAEIIQGVLQTRWRAAADIEGPIDTQAAATRHCDAWRDLLATIDAGLQITVTLTTSPKLAFEAFANLNYTGRPLSVADVLRACVITAAIDGGDNVQGCFNG
jgi:hypothetical protein